MDGARRYAVPDYQFENFREFLGFVASTVEEDYCAKHAPQKREGHIVLFHRAIGDDVCTRIIETFEERRRASPMDYLPSPTKQGGYFCFWVRKLKPYYISPEYANELPLTMSVYLNEVCAWFGGIWLMQFLEQYTGKGKTDITADAKIMNEILPDLRYHTMSPTAVVLMYQAFTHKV